MSSKFNNPMMITIPGRTTLDMVQMLAVIKITWFIANNAMYVITPHFFIIQKPIILTSPTRVLNARDKGYHAPMDLAASEKISGMLNMLPINPNTQITVIITGLLLVMYVRVLCTYKDFSSGLHMRVLWIVCLEL